MKAWSSPETATALRVSRASRVPRAGSTRDGTGRHCDSEEA